MAATNRPFDLDEAALRRLTRRIYLPLPDDEARQALIESKIKDAKSDIEDFAPVVKLTEGYSSADLVFLVKEAAMQPVREIPTEKLLLIKDMTEIRGVQVKDFEAAMKAVTPSVSKATIAEFEKWQKEKSNP